MLKNILLLKILMAFNSLANGYKDVPILRVVGGEMTSQRDYPHSVYLKINVFGDYSSFTCGGSILTSRVILTAAHCFEDMTEQKSTASIGNEDPSLASQVIPIIKAVVHEKFTLKYTGTFDYDVAILYTKTAIKLSQDVKKVVLNTKMYPAGTVAYIAGWGKTTIYEQIPFYNPEHSVLKAVHQHVFDQHVCHKGFGNYTSNMLCAGRNTPGQQIYKGDSGSALVVDGFIQIGIVSFGAPLLTSTTVFTNVVPLRDWIEKTVLKLHNRFCKPK